jgi:hypothetical protein
VSNYVETEFLIYNSSFQASFLQIRGSVPVFWEQTGIQVSHKIVLSRGPESTLPAARSHFEVGRVSIIHLRVYISHPLLSLNSLVMYNIAHNHSFIPVQSTFFIAAALCPFPHRRT